jgi:hypothetical protein
MSNWALAQHTRTAAADLREQIKTEDEARNKFMRMLDNAYRGGRLRLVEFETEFLATWANSLPSKPYWTPRRRQVADELRRKYA